MRGASQSFGGFEFYGGAATDVSAVRDMTIIAPDTGYACVALFGAGALEADHLPLEADAGIFADTDASRVTVDQVQLIAPGRGSGVETRGGGTITVSSSTFSNAAVGLRFAYGSVTVTGTTVDDCHVMGAWVGTYPDLIIEPPVPTVTMTGTTFADNTQGVVVTRGTVTLDTVAITDDPLRTESAQVGVYIEGGAIAIANTTISGQHQQGIALAADSSQLDASLLVDRTTITRGQVGIDIRGFDQNTSFSLRRSTIRNQTSASVRLRGNQSRFDLGSATSPGRNRLSVRRGFALDDARDNPAPDAFPIIPAVGTTLNGTSYAGQTIPGPTTIAPDLRILGTGILQF